MTIEPTPQPDLIVSDKWEESVNEEVIVHFIVTNIGEADAGSSTACLEINGIDEDTVSVPALAVGVSHVGAFAPEPCPPLTTITVTVCADNFNEVEESDESNNCLEYVWTCIPPGECWAVIVGVSNYADPSIHDLSYCDDDANDIYSRLLSYDNWKASNIVLLKFMIFLIATTMQTTYTVGC
jgi:subtilase family serine protease